MLTGRIIAESLRPGGELALPDMRLTRVVRVEVDGSPTQPRVWTLIDVEGPDHLADDLAVALADALDDGPNWYADFRVGGDHVIVFPKRVFRYAVGDQEGRRAASDYGAALGIPEDQLDWGD